MLCKDRRAAFFWIYIVQSLNEGDTEKKICKGEWKMLMKHLICYTFNGCTFCQTKYHSSLFLIHHPSHPDTQLCVVVLTLWGNP